ncbi:YlxR family protein [Pseudactinotalea suaedae]
MRTCAGCRGKAHRSDLVRMVVDRRAATAVVVVDPRAVLPGRGVWLHQRSDCLDRAETRRAIQRGLRVAQSLPLEQVRAWFDSHA